MASMVAGSVSTTPALLAANPSRKRRCLRARPPMMASAYTYRSRANEPTFKACADELNRYR